MKLLNVALCVRNEEKTIEKIILKLLRLKIINTKIKIYAVDNCSTDKTPIILNKYKKKIKIIRQKINKGKGNSVKKVIKIARGDYLIPQDADLEYDPADIKKIFNCAEKFNSNLIIGTRKKGNKRFHKYLINEMGANILSAIFNICFNIKFTDVASCYKLMDLNLLKKMKLKCNGFDLDYELASKFVKINKSKCKEISISYNSRSYAEGRKTRIFLDGFKAIFVILREKLFS
jgi:dolichol-phosphate mannosyltransferase